MTAALLVKSVSAWKRHGSKLDAQVAELSEALSAAAGTQIDADPLDLLMFALGDQASQTALIAFFRGDAAEHPLQTMSTEDV